MACDLADLAIGSLRRVGATYLPKYQARHRVDGEMKYTCPGGTGFRHPQLEQAAFAAFVASSGEGPGVVRDTVPAASGTAVTVSPEAGPCTPAESLVHAPYGVNVTGPAAASHGGTSS